MNIAYAFSIFACLAAQPFPSALAQGKGGASVAVQWPKAGEKNNDLPAAAGTTIKGGTLRTQKWTAAGSPYRVTGDIVLPEGQELRIEAGVTVIFMGAYKFSVYGGRLILAGKAAQPVRLTASLRDPGWYGILFCPEATCTKEVTKGELLAEHAIFEYARANDKEGSFRYWRRGGALLLLNTQSVKISKSQFRYNFAHEVGGALELIAIANGKEAQLDDIDFFANEAGSGGAIRLSHINHRTWSGLHFEMNRAQGWNDSFGGAIELNDAHGIVLSQVLARSNTAKALNKSLGLGGAFYCHAPTLKLQAPYLITGNTPEDSTGCGVEAQLKADKGQQGRLQRRGRN